MAAPARLDLPLIAGPSPDWHGWRPAGPLPAPADAPEPARPQGDYADAPAPFVPPAPRGPAAGPVELLAPAGGPDAAFAAFHYGADAVYLGLKKFSARAEAENFTLAELDEVTAYAHSLRPRRRVFVTVNTLIRQDELPELVEAVAALEAIGVDALIVQDLGVYHLVRTHFPGVELHASTQLAVHNRAGAQTLHRLGFTRVVLARELTFEEVADITAAAGVETEVFIHGALCYAYSGLCLFSSQTLGRSGNRGKCAYSCRDSYEVEGAPHQLRDGRPVRRDPRRGFPFSMKDLALPDHLPALRAAGVACFKVEGRKKSPLYVATTTDYYRRLLDGRLSDAERPAVEADLQTVFSRPWTRLFVDSHTDKEVADRDTVGHRGTPVGAVEAVLGGPAPRLRFRTGRALERHDGLQIDLPALGKPFGFAVERLWRVEPRGRREEVVQVPAGAVVEVSLPRDHPELPVGATVYCSSSQAVKNRYRFGRPRPGLYRTRRAMAVELELTEGKLTGVARLVAPGASGGLTPPDDRPQGTPVPQSPQTIEVQRMLPGPFPPARDPAAVTAAARAAFERLGDSRLEMTSFALRNDDNRFVPVSRLNALRRDLVADLERAADAQQRQRVAAVLRDVCPTPTESAPGSPRSFRWSLKVDRVGSLDALIDDDLDGVDEIVIDIARDHPALLAERLDAWAARLGRDRLRLALPALTRRWEERGLLHKVERFRAAGWAKWEAANLSAWTYLGLDIPASPFAGEGRTSSPSSLVGEDGGAGALSPPTPTLPHKGGGSQWAARSADVDLSTDWSVYVLNRLAARELLRLGVSRFALSPEDGLANVRPLLAEFGARAVVIVYQDTPLFVAESCAYANLIGGCPGKANCRFERMDMVSSHGERVTALDYHCRTIVLNRGPYCVAPRLNELAAAGAVSLRADFVYRPYEPAELRDVWRRVRAGRPVPGGHAANFDRGVL